MLLLLGAGVLAAAQTSGGKPAPAPAKEAAPADFVGAETCAACHEEVARNFATNPHSKLALEHGKSGVPSDRSSSLGWQNGATCESCHGEGKISCVNCHSVHAAATPEKLLKAAQPALCYQCHNEVRPQFSMPFHHRINEGLMNCSDCHNPHGTTQGKMLRSTAGQNAICTKCHSEVAGPFVYEHPVVKVEGCTSCHTPHGSPKPRLLNVSNMNTLCLQCHSATNAAAFPHAVSPTGPAHSQVATEVACTNCHTQIHGSNASNIFFK
jgi:DmsE family decaheme c-type cytochrome